MPTTTPQPEPRVRLPRTQRRALLLDAALGAFSETGYHATAMDDIAERAGVSKPVLYQHFDSKLDLYLAIATRVADEVVATVQAALASTDDNKQRIAACLDSYFAFVGRPGSGYPLLFVSDASHEPAVADLLDDTRRACGEAIGRVLQDQTDLPWEECVHLGIALAGTAQSSAMHWYQHQDGLSRERASQLCAALVWRGLGGVPPKGGAEARRPAG